MPLSVAQALSSPSISNASLAHTTQMAPQCGIPSKRNQMATAEIIIGVFEIIVPSVVAITIAVVTWRYRLSKRRNALRDQEIQLELGQGMTSKSHADH
ncbi:hypothetical protein CC80DRAFT_496200 [Byssothecium circinans]|uniref:Uncharacterized protein n=1 Tax=Byssothecium circinans TaxID=147558 RepID=A0A6A5THC8_9PLEO|nr:hypothetical protein CC80DRAFT_496200 [Byssothecium circinans]